MPWRKMAQSVALIVIFLSPAPAMSAEQDVVLKARKFLEENNPRAAYDLLAPLESENAGDPEYDYLLGVAALDLGLNTDAIFALERVLAVEPSNPRARAQIARAYFAVQETQAAKTEFEKVKRQDVSSEVRQTIDRYLDAIAGGAPNDGFKARFFLEFAAGWDSNVNSATAVEEVAIPVFGNVVTPLAPASIQRPDAFFSFTAGTTFQNALSQSTSLVGGLSADKRNNFTQDNFSNGYLEGHLGFARKYQHDTWTLVGEANMFFLDDPHYSSEYRDALGGTAQWTRDLDARNQFTTYVQYASLAYPQQSFLNANRYIAGMGYAHAFTGGGLIVYVGAYGGLERTRDERFDYLSYRAVGLRIGGQKTLTEGYLVFCSVSSERRQYEGADPMFLLGRDDRQYTASAGLTRQLANGWKLSPQIAYLANISNVPINAYHQTMVYATLRRDF